MTLEELVLEKVAEWRLPSKQRQTLTLPHAESGWTLHLTADHTDEIGCQAWELLLQRQRPADVPTTLQGWAERIPNQVTGLLENLRVHEVDVQRNEALLRSNNPTRRNGELFYYELTLKGTDAALLRRYKNAPVGGKRTQVLFTLTHEVLAKVSQDLIS